MSRRKFIDKLYLKCKSLHRAFSLWQDYREYVLCLQPYKKFIRKIDSKDKGALLILSGCGMNVLWAQIWSMYSIPVRMTGVRGIVLTSRKDSGVNRYYRFLKLDLIFYEDIVAQFSREVSPEVMEQMCGAKTVEQYREIVYRGIPVGEIALSSFTRSFGTGLIDLDDSKVTADLQRRIAELCRAGDAAELVYRDYDVLHLFVAEIFFDEFGAFYYTAIRNNLNIIKFTSTVRDEAILLQHMNKENDRRHHASLSPQTWDKLKKIPVTPQVDADLAQNFVDRYTHKWHRSKRNFLHTKIMPVDEARAILGLRTDRKVAVIFSHILYDTLFFFGTDLFEDYATCLVETVRVACKNDNVDWLVKVHPSNLWRGELNTILKGRYAEEQLIEKNFGKLPSHVRVIGAETKINPYTWFQLADYGVTVRGTSGIEMAALGKKVITAGTGRYEGHGFTVDSADRAQYCDALMRIHDLPPPTGEQVALAKRYAYGLFVLKPFVMNSLQARMRTGVRAVVASDDLAYMPAAFYGKGFPEDLQIFSKWAFNSQSLELVRAFE